LYSPGGTKKGNRQRKDGFRKVFLGVEIFENFFGSTRSIAGKTEDVKRERSTVNFFCDELREGAKRDGKERLSLPGKRWSRGNECSSETTGFEKFPRDVMTEIAYLILVHG